MQDVEIHGLDQLSKALGEIVRKAPDMQRAVHEKLGDSCTPLYKVTSAVI